MRIDIITVLPDLLTSPFSHSILKRARERELLAVNVYNLRDYTSYKHGQVDDYQFGGGAGMVMMPEPLANAIETLSKDVAYDEIIYVTPDGKRFDQKMANQLSLKQNLQIVEEPRFELFWNEILIPNLKAKHNVKPVHTIEEITLLHKRFPENIRHFNVYHSGKIVAGDHSICNWYCSPSAIYIRQHR